MQIILLSDTHNQLSKINIPDCDMIIHAGDLTGNGTLIEISKELVILGKLPHKYKIFCAGNHDFLFQDNSHVARQIALDNGLIYLENNSVSIENINIYGSPFTPFFYNWAFNLAKDGSQAKSMWDMIPDNTNVLITHGPPRTILDALLWSPDGINHEHVGCPKLMNRVLDLQELTLHTFGHIHAGYGNEQHGSKHFINASICNEQYDPINKPYIVDIDNTTKQITLL